MTRIEGSIEINASPEKVWSMIVHDRLPEWFDLFKKIELTSKEDDKLGATHHMTSELYEILKIEWDGAGEVFLNGTAETVFTGDWPD